MGLKLDPVNHSPLLAAAMSALSVEGADGMQPGDGSGRAVRLLGRVLLPFQALRGQVWVLGARTVQILPLF